jgi:hypothetical protein
MQFENFKFIIESIKNKIELNAKNGDVLSAMYGSFLVIDDPIISDIVKFLELELGDISEWISYWIFDLDFGQKYRPGFLINQDGAEIPLITIEDLWNLVNRYENEKQSMRL